MTVAERSKAPGRLLTVTEETKGQTEAEGRAVRFEIQKGKIFANLRIGADVAGAVPLKANDGLSTRGVMLFGRGFIVTEEQACSLGLGADEKVAQVIKPYRNGRDLLGVSRGVYTPNLPKTEILGGL